MDPAEALMTQETARYRVINEMIARGDSPVQQFYAGAVVLVTGASGFLGKQLVEKLLRSCEIKKMYILLRSNRHGNAQDRRSKLLTDSVYDCLRTIRPDFEDKIEVVSGDVTKPRLGLNDGDWINIKEEVTVIFHGAATISFTDPLKKATVTNVCGTKQMIFLAKDCKKLRSLVYVSTAYTHAKYSNAGQEVLEQFYESPMSPEALIQIVEGTEEDTLNTITPQIINGWPNTYSFTKAVAEELVRTMAADLPVCIVRPAIVVSTYREPSPGWLDKRSVLGHSGVVVGSITGVLHVIKADKSLRQDLVPVDMVNNATIVAAQETAQRRARGLNDVKIYTVSADRNPLELGRAAEILREARLKYATTKSMWFAEIMMTRNQLLFNVLHIFLHLIPGYLIDGLLILLGRKPLLTKVYATAHKLLSVLSYYTLHMWKFRDSNLRELYYGLSPADRTIYYCDMETLDWSRYVLTWGVGVRKYILKDGLKDTKKAVQRQKVLRIVNYIFVPLYAYCIYKVVVVGSITGVLHVIKADKSLRQDLVPVDMVNNATIVAAQETAQRCARGLNDVKIYTVSADRNPLELGRAAEILREARLKYATTKSMWFAEIMMTRNQLLFNVLHIFLHLIPGYLIDGLLILLGRKPLLTKVYATAHKLLSVLSYYTLHMWKFRDSNLRELYYGLSPADRTIYYCDMETLDWSRYVLTWGVGVRKYILKDGLKDTKKAVQRQKVLRIVNYIFVPLYAYCIYKVVSVLFKAAFFILFK